MEVYKARLKFKADLMKQRAGQNDVMLAQQFDIIRKTRNSIVYDKLVERKR